MKSVVLAEKPSVGKELARVLACKQVSKGHSEGNQYVVTWAMGHLVELAEPAAYDERYRTWSLDYLPMLPPRMKHEVIRRTSHQFRTIKGLLNRKDINNVIIATDAGREGELVARWIMRLAGWKGSYQRLWISSQTDSAIRDGFRDLKNGHLYDSLFHAAESRVEADWIIGLNISRALSCKHDARLSAGRVQTPTLAMITQREKEITGFRPEAFWTLHADFGPFKGIWQGAGGATRIKDQNHARGVAEKLRGCDAVIVEATSKEKSEPPPLAYDLTALQRDANTIHGFSAKKTLQVLQGLYERHKYATYPRTDSRHITKDIVPTLKDRISAIADTPLGSIAKNLLNKNLQPGKRLVDERKVTDHHAIIPTEEKVQYDRLNGDERAIWELIAKRFLVVLSPPYRYRSISIITRAGNEKFVSRGVEVIELGWKKIWRDREEEPQQNLPRHEKGETFKIKAVDVKQDFTKPPTRYTEASLLGAMESPGKFIEDEQLRRSISKGGLGTPATRAEIIEKLISSYYIERRGKELHPTSRGVELLELVPNLLTSPELTAQWELRLNDISEGREKPERFNADIRKSAKELVAEVVRSKAEYKPRNVGSTPCPMCGKQMLSVLGPKGRKKNVCRSLSCGYEQEEENESSFLRKPSRKEQQMGRHLMRKYSDNTKDTSSFADLIKASQERKKKK